MDHSGHDSADSGTMAMMVPYLHFSGGDFLFFKAWQPTSAGAIAGASIGLIILALFERWLAATRGVLAMQWNRQALAMVASRDQSVLAKKISPGLEISSAEDVLKTDNDVQEVARQQTCKKPQSLRSGLRTIPPFIFAHDVPRGILYALQMLVAYSLMLAVMTFQAAYLISIVAGLGIGEILFGRLVGHTDMH